MSVGKNHNQTGWLILLKSIGILENKAGTWFWRCVWILETFQVCVLGDGCWYGTLSGHPSSLPSESPFESHLQVLDAMIKAVTFHGTCQRKIMSDGARRRWQRSSRAANPRSSSCGVGNNHDCPWWIIVFWREVNHEKLVVQELCWIYFQVSYFYNIQAPIYLQSLQIDIYKKHGNIIINISSLNQNFT